MMKPLLTTTLFFVLTIFLTTLAAAQAIRGTVFDPEGNPAPGAVVALVNPEDYTDRSRQTLAADDGTFVLDFEFLAEKKLPAFMLTAAKEETLGYLYLLQSEMIPENAEIRLEPAVRIRGKVVDENEQPVADARVGFAFAINSDVKSDASGQFELLLVPQQWWESQGNYRAYKEGYALAFAPGGSFSGKQPPITLRLEEKRKKAVFRAVDTEGKPVSGVNFSHNHINTGSSLYYAIVWQKTDSEGLVVFDCIPDWVSTPITFYITSTDTGHSPSRQPKFDPNADSGKEIQVEMVPPVKLGGTILLEDGTPLADTTITLQSCYTQERPPFHGTTKTDSQGKYEFLVYPDLVYFSPVIAEAGVEYVIFDPSDRIIFPGQPVSDFDFVAQKTYKVHGQVHLPPDLTVDMFPRYSIDNGGSGIILALTGENAQNPQGRLVATDSKGETFEYYTHHDRNISVEYEQGKPMKYEIRLPRGRFTVSHVAEPGTIEVTGDEPEVVFDLTLVKPDNYRMPGAVSMGGTSKTVTGKVFRKDGEAVLPVVGAILEEERDGSGKAVSDENGGFTLTTTGWSNNPAVFARTDDFSQVGFGKFTKEGEPVKIELFPAASLKARLVLPETGKPLANAKVEGIGPVAMGEGMIVAPYLNNLTTDSDGHFAAKGFISGKMYQFYANLPERPADNVMVMIGMFLALDPEEFDAGDITVITIQSSRQMEEYVLAPFRQEESPTVRFDKALQQSRESQKPVLVLFAHTDINEDAPSFMMWVMSVVFGIQGQKYLAGYEYVPVDATNTEQATALAEKLGVTLPEEDAFTILVCDSNGQTITRRDSRTFNAPQFKPDGAISLEFDPVMLLTFLREFGK